jgi:NAD+ synthetase
MNSEKVVKIIRKQLENYILKYNIKSLIIGESGGIDSALCSVLASPVCKKNNIQLIGRSITIETNTEGEINRGKLIGEAFCTNFKDVNLTELYLTTLKTIEEGEIDLSTIENKIRYGNIKARLRMVYLYNLAQQNGGLVLSTDNYTELLEGYWTLHGDVGDYGMIQSLWKTEVYELSKYLIDNELNNEQKYALQLCVNAVPTDGLGITNSDLEQLDAKNYDEVDFILKDFLENGNKKWENHSVIKRHFRSEYKRNNPFNIKREIIFGVD